MNNPPVFSPKAYRRILMPGFLFVLTLVIVVLLWITMVNQDSVWERLLFLGGLFGSLYGFVVGFFFYRENDDKRQKHFDWLHIVIVGVSLGIVLVLVPAEIFAFTYTLFVLNVISASLAFSVKQVRVLVLLAFLVHAHGYFQEGYLSRTEDLAVILSFPSLGLIVSEMVHWFQETILHTFRRLNTVNAISRKLSSSLDEEEVHAWLKEAIRGVLDADTYYLALVDDDYLDLGLFYDDGEYFHAVKIPIEGTLGGWAIRNEKTLFLNDLRIEPKLEGVKTRLVGKERASLSWLGVPFKTEHVVGLTGIASYSPLAFTQRDVELLESLTQQAALALNNARQHKLVTMQARIDSLTKVYNHGYFLEHFKEELASARSDNTHLSVIMLDVDFFKDYNDTYGHLIGDEVLMLMVKTIKRFIKESDAIGRWGGEEFIICLPKTSLEKAQLVAVRIQETLEKMKISVLDHQNIPVPTVSQGIAEFPREADDAFRLIDLADQRLYVAKERGRNQVEPGPLG